MFITAVCVIFLIKLRWPKSKSLYKKYICLKSICSRQPDCGEGQDKVSCDSKTKICAWDLTPRKNPTEAVDVKKINPHKLKKFNPHLSLPHHFSDGPSISIYHECRVLIGYATYYLLV